MEVQAEMNLPLHKLFFSTYLPIDGPFGGKERDGTVIPKHQAFIRLFISGFLSFFRWVSQTKI